MTGSVAKGAKCQMSTSVNLVRVTFSPIVRIPWAVISVLVFLDMKEMALIAKVRKVDLL